MISQYKFEHTLWKVIPDTFHQLIALELRNKESRQVEYGFLNLEDVSFQKLYVHEKDTWWTGLLDFYLHKLLLHGYEETGLPGHKGLFVYDASNNQLLWKDPEFLLKQTGLQGVMDLNGRIWNWENGQPIEATYFEPLSTQRSKRQLFPSLHLEGSQEFLNWKGPLNEFLGQEPIAQIAIRSLGRRTFLQCYTGKLGQQLLGHWLEFSEEKRKFNLLAHSNLNGLLLDAFFIELPYLFFMPKEDTLAWMKLE